MVTIKKLGVFSVAKFQAVFMAFFGLIAAVFLSVIVTSLGALGKMMVGSGGITGMLAAKSVLFLIIGLPVIYGIFGFVIGAIFALLYNLVARLIGGIEFEAE